MARQKVLTLLAEDPDCRAQIEGLEEMTRETLERKKWLDKQLEALQEDHLKKKKVFWDAIEESLRVSGRLPTDYVSSRDALSYDDEKTAITAHIRDGMGTKCGVCDETHEEGSHGLPQFIVDLLKGKK